MSNDLIKLINEITDIVYESSDKAISKKEICCEYVDQILTRDYSCLMNFLWNYHRKYYFKLKMQINKEIKIEVE